jgi:hypothetical protein
LPVIPATWEAETRRPAWAKMLERLISTYELGVVVGTCHPSYKRERRSGVQPLEKPYLRITKRDGRGPQVAEHCLGG